MIDRHFIGDSAAGYGEVAGEFAGLMIDRHIEADRYLTNRDAAGEFAGLMIDRHICSPHELGTKRCRRIRRPDDRPTRECGVGPPRIGTPANSPA